MPTKNIYYALIVVFVSLFIASKTSLKEQIVRDVARQLEKNALSRPSRETLLQGAVEGMANAVGDAPYTAYLPPSKQTDYKLELQGQFAGVGLSHFVRDAKSGEFYFVPIRNSPADKSGLKFGDRIVEVDGVRVSSMTIFELMEKLQGKEDTTVSLAIRPRSTITGDLWDNAVSNGIIESKSNDAEDGDDGEGLNTIVVTRGIVQQNIVSGDRLDEDGRWVFTLKDDPAIGYIAIEQFVDSTGRQTRDALNRLYQDGVSKVILDFRGNPGGFLPNAVAICEELLAEGSPIVETRNNKGMVNRYVARSKNGKRFRVAVLVDHDSASASEIVAAALQDAGVAKVVGERSYGKGTIQSIYDLPCNFGVLRMTSGSFWRPSGKPIHRKKDASSDDEWGVSPDQDFEVLVSPLERFYFRWIRAVRVSNTEATALDSKAIALISQQTNLILERFQDSSSVSKLESFAEIGLDIETPSQLSVSTLLGKSNPHEGDDDFNDTKSKESPNEGESSDESSQSETANVHGQGASSPPAFYPRGRAPYFDPQLDRAVDYLQSFEVRENESSSSSIDHEPKEVL